MSGDTPQGVNGADWYFAGPFKLVFIGLGIGAAAMLLRAAPDGGFLTFLRVVLMLAGLLAAGGAVWWRLSTSTTDDFEEQSKTGMLDAAVVGRGYIRGRPVVVGITDFAFIAGSMGSVVGEKLTRAAEEATKRMHPLIFVSGSGGGARMQEGILSLMQMAKVSAALARYDQAGGLYVSVLTNPTMGGVAASFALQGDVTLAEPGALIGFAGQRVIEQTIREKLPEGFQRAEYLLEHGMIDMVVHRSGLKERLALLIDYLCPEAKAAA